MALTKKFTQPKITELDSYRTYLQDVGANSGRHLDNCFASGTISVWLYMKAIGLETEFFELIKKAKDYTSVIKELMYLLQLTNSNTSYFPQIPKDLLRLEIPGLVADAQIEITQPDFKLAFVLDDKRILEVLKGLAVKNRMIRLGDKTHAIGIMFAKDKYCIYHSGNSEALEYSNINDCVAAALRALKDLNSKAVYCESYHVFGLPTANPPIALELFAKFAKTYTEDELLACLKICVLSNDIETIKFMQKLDVNFNHQYLGIDLLNLAVSQPQLNVETVKCLLDLGVDRVQAISTVIARKKEEKDPAVAEVDRLLHDHHKPHSLLHSVGASKPRTKSNPSNT